ncbi:11123_t:CDS:10 [Acaulospora morrowiae]|uniref:ubiquitinyl hydrolase 1 n=1 Tax=Acaulospora morrowiae TaxID=94023 RepID=A0A9N9G3G6_9GLOM|nr:11123_t:CDS:10 [Acaulospora morrowiae]
MSDAGQWCLIESDPGVFTELIRRLNVEGTQVEEVWSLDDQTLEELKPVYGLIFLFKWQGGNDSSKLHPDADLSIDNRVINNACATQAILSILLNCPLINLGPDLENLKEFTKDFDSYYKGLTISNSTLIRSVHNSFARSDPFFMDQTDVPSSEKEDIFHFISYVPVHGALYELDGLSEGPVNLGPCTEDDWLEKVRPVIHERMARYASAEIRFNLLALIKNREEVYQARINEIELNIEYANRDAESETVMRLNEDKNILLQKIELEREKFKRYERENSLRKHNFVPFIYNIIRILAERGELQGRIEYAKKEMTKRKKERAEKKKQAEASVNTYSVPFTDTSNARPVVNDEAEVRPLVGIIYPPPDIRNIVDKTAVFVARNGVQFEERIRENEKHNVKFSFLNSNDPYHAYYQYKIAETKEGKVSKKVEPKEMRMEIKDEGPPPKAPPKEPPSFEFMSDMPAISAQDLDILKLTAQFVARNGRQFMTALSQREQRNYQFDFLRPNHSLCNYFTKLVEQYAKVLVPPKNLNEKLKSNVNNKYQILELAYASIDWHDFVIVETVEFTEADETIDLPPPMSIIELENMTLTQKKMASVNIVETQEDKAAEIDMEMDDDVDMVDDDNQEAEDEEQDHDNILAVTEIKPPDASAPMKIVKDYTPKAYAPKVTTEKPTVICPRCKQAIPVDEMDDHVRIELLDPKWKEQKMAAEAKKKESNLLQEGTDVAKNLKAFSGYRSDIFGNEETEIGRKVLKLLMPSN